MQALRGKVVVVGASYGGMNNAHLTPYGRGLFDAPLMLGAEIQAQTTDALLSARFVDELSATWRLLLAVMLVMPAAVWWWRKRPVAGLAILMLPMSLAALAGYIGFAYRLQVPVAHLQLAAGLAYAGIYGWRFAHGERERDRLRGIFSRYLEPKVVEALLGSEAPEETQRTEFSQVLMKDDLATAIKKINAWIEDDQVQEVIEKVTRFDGDNLLQNNQQALELLLKGTSIGENRKSGEKSPDVSIVDFDHPENNSYVATVSQFKVRIPGTDNHIYPDIICFLNGLPVVVIEAKSPKAKEPIPEAIDQMMRYCEQRNYQREGNKSHFYFNQFLIATSRQKAKFGTITTTIEKLFYRWTDPFPATIDELINYCNTQEHLFQ